ncbi:MAG TPA: agmatine deiminase family protein [Pirellulaceae bacterium]|nr:agmatine deiminase family protein [Pirellulaceae bacterium]
MSQPELPAQLGYRWPAEWEPHAATWLSWPRNPETWPQKFGPVPGEFAQLVRTIAQFEPVHILAGGEAVMRQARALVGKLPNVTLHDIPTNDAWCRDHGPTFLSVQSPKSKVQSRGANDFGLWTLDSGLAPALIDWEYNAWGGKYPPFDLDNQVPRKIAALQGRRVFSPGIILEGGAIEGNGEGVLLTTESCLLNPNRNPHLSREETEKYLRDYLGVKEIWWLKGGEIAGDDTDGHIDQIARFVGPRTIVVGVCDDPSDENYGPTQQNLAELLRVSSGILTRSASEGESGQPSLALRVSIVPLPLPGPKYVGDQRLPAGYANFIFVNGGLIVPTYNDPADRVAIDTLQKLRPDRRVVGLPSLNLVWGLGSFHCLSQQEPLA